MTFSPESPLRQATGAVSRLAATEALVLDLGSERIFRLDPVGARIWGLIGEKRTFREILAVIVAEYEVEPERARADLDRLVGELAALGLVQVGDVRG